MDLGRRLWLVVLLIFVRMLDCKVFIMVPTEILALQHRNITKTFISFWCKNGIIDELVLEAKRKCLLENIANGEADVIIGTHALIQKTVS